MKFGPVSPKEAIGGVAVHAIRQSSFTLKKGTLITPIEAEALEQAGIKQIVVARLEDGDVSEDAAAAGIARMIAGEGIQVEKAFTGRCNLFAAHPGILVIDRDAVDELNRVDESITFATLPAFKAVAEGEMIATVKLIPFGIEQAVYDKAADAAKQRQIKIMPFSVKRVGVVSTMLPGLAPKVIDKTVQVTRERLARAGASIIAERRVQHSEPALKAAVEELLGLGSELVLIFGASAIADRRDIIPSAVEKAGGKVEHFGMPVDPGNLLLVARIGDVPVLGAPGCARSPKENGFDWVLMRLLANLKVTREEITAMGVGGLLMEIISRPQSREPEKEVIETDVTAIILAAGRSTRMGGPNKLLAKIGSKPLVRIAAEQALASRAESVVVVTGHQHEQVEEALQGLDVMFVHNPDYAEGLATSLKSGINAVPASSGAAIVCLGDMPLVGSGLIDRLIEAYAPERDGLIAIPVADGRRGNPVLWSRKLFKELLALDGDIGARHVVQKYAEMVVEVPATGVGAFLDVDTPDVLAKLLAKR
ncbi:MAG: molybdopterin-binding/glycosyltransferase family 2 protein [Afipia felis]|nr:molybdopterin-binding/glycosyltransferase family 2 protein [Afipia felis]